MLRKTLSLTIPLLLLFSLLLPVSAQSISRIVDGAGLLLPEEISILEEKSAHLENDYGIHAIVLTVDSLNGSRIQDYADDYYDRGGYGNDGVLFLLDMEEQEWYISTCGTLIYVLTDFSIQQLGESVVPYLADELWYDGFSCFLDSLPVYLDAFESGTPVDGYADHSGDYYHGDQDTVVYFDSETAPSFLFSLLCGIVIAGIVVLVMRLSMNTKRPQRCANIYMIDGSWNLTHHADIFLYSNVTKTRKRESYKTTGGGSSAHRSYSGRSHGGGGGKF